VIFDAIEKAEAVLRVWEQALVIHSNMPKMRSRMSELKRELTNPPT
jgi:hypothetical protein